MRSLFYFRFEFVLISNLFHYFCGRRHRGRREEVNKKPKKLECLPTSRARNDDSDAVAKLPEARKTHVRDCVGILAMLRERRVGEASEKEKAAEGDQDEEKEERRKKPFLVASTHLFWDPAFPDVKLAQTERLLAETREFVRAFRKASGASGEKSAGDSPQKTSVPVIVAGDFNSVPGSDVHAAALESSERRLAKDVLVLAEVDGLELDGAVEMRAEHRNLGLGVQRQQPALVLQHHLDRTKGTH